MKLFVADLHLDPDRPETLSQFRHCLAQYADRLSELYILGDLFEFWIGDDHLTDTANHTADLLRSLGDSGVGVFFMPGNRDFLLGQAYASLCGMDLLDDGTVIDIGGTPTLLSHGDHLCTDDHVYQAIRAKVRSSQWQEAVLSQSIEARLQLAQQARGDSKTHTSLADETIMDVNAEAVIACMESAGVRQMIHGHTHRPAVHDLTVNQEPARRLVLGDWYAQRNIRVVVDSELIDPKL